MPVESFKPASLSDDDLFAKVKEADEANQVMTAGCQNEVPGTGLVTGHAYTVIGVGDTPGTLKMRNPWGSENYVGPGADDKDDGIFNLPVGLFRKGFTNISFAYLDNYNITRMTSQKKQGREVDFDFTSDKDGDVYVTLDYEAERRLAPMTGCTQVDHNYNIYVHDFKSFIAGPIGTYRSMGYGMVKIAAKAGMKYQVQFYDWGDYSQGHDLAAQFYPVNHDATLDVVESESAM